MRTVLSEQHVCGSCGRPVMYLDFGGRIVVCEGRVAIGGPTILLNTHRCLDAVSFVGVAADGSTPLPEWIVAAIGGTTILLNTHRCCDAVSFVGVAADGSTPLPEWIVGRIHETLAASPFGLTLSEIRARAFSDPESISATSVWQAVTELRRNGLVDVAVGGGVHSSNPVYKINPAAFAVVVGQG